MYLLRLCAVLIAVAPFRLAHAATEIPDAPSTWVTDRAAFLSPAAAAKLSERLADYERATGHQVIVYIDRTTGAVPIEDWASRAFERWHIGRQGLDDGAVLFVFGDDRRVRIEVGYGLEERLPDATAGRIIAGAVVPRLRAGDRDGAVVAGVEGIVAAIGDSTTPPDVPVAIPIWLVVVGGIVFVVVLGILITHPMLAAWLLVSLGSNRRGGSGGWGGRSGSRFSGGGGRSGGGGASGSW